MSFRILVADDHEVVRRGLCALLRNQPEWEVCGEAGDGREAVEKVLTLKPEVVILDIGMPNLNGLEATRQILKTNPRIKVLVLTLHDSDQVVQEVLNAGARGFLLKTDAARDLVAAVEALRRGKTYFTPKVAAMVLDGYLRRENGTAPERPARRRLTPREREVVQLLAEGKSSKEVAVVLGLRCENCRNSPFQHHAQTGTAFGQRLSALRRSKQHYTHGAAQPLIPSPRGMEAGSLCRGLHAIPTADQRWPGLGSRSVNFSSTFASNRNSLESSVALCLWCWV